jgi:PBP1b-binding outer membrane lipoprotein LpoB
MQKIIMILIIAIVFVGCSQGVNTEKEASKKLEKIEQKVTDGLDEELTLQILKNEQVEDAYVQEKGSTAKAVLTLKKGTSDNEKSELIEEYNKELTKKYPNKNINVIVTVSN